MRQMDDGYEERQGQKEIKGGKGGETARPRSLGGGGA